MRRRLRATAWKPGTVAEALQTARVGHAVGQILQGQIAFPLVVRYAHDDSTALDSIGDDADPDAGPAADPAVGGCRPFRRIAGPTS